VEIANEMGAYLIVRDRQAAKRLSEQTNRFPVTFEELLDSRMEGSRVRNIVIDDADEFLRRICGG